MSKIYEILDKILSKIRVIGNYDVINGTGTHIASGSSWSGVECYTTLPAGGYILIAYVRIGANSTGTRGLRIYNTTDNEVVSGATQQVPAAASSGFSTVLSVSTYVEISSSKEFSVQAIQNCGSILTVSSVMKYVRLK